MITCLIFLIIVFAYCIYLNRKIENMRTSWLGAEKAYKRNFRFLDDQVARVRRDLFIFKRFKARENEEAYQ